jgi:hypothetical protein
MAERIATYVKDVEGFRGVAKLFKMSPPVKYESYTAEGDFEFVTKTSEFVVVSATVVSFSGPETYIFPADSEGVVTSWGELDGSYRGSLNHTSALERAGYVVE